MVTPELLTGWHLLGAYVAGLLTGASIGISFCTWSLLRTARKNKVNS